MLFTYLKKQNRYEKNNTLLITELNKYKMTKLELKEWITELACSLDRGDLRLDDIINEVEEVVDKNITEQLTLTDVSQQSELLSDLIDFSNNNAPPIIQKGLKQVILEFNQSLNCC